MEVSGQLHVLATSPPEKSPLYPLDKRPAGSQTGLDTVKKRKIPSPRRKSNPHFPIVQSAASCYTDSWIMLLVS